MGSGGGELRRREFTLTSVGEMVASRISWIVDWVVTFSKLASLRVMVMSRISLRSVLV